ncbi:MAG: helicase-related protein, partial [Paracoccaceae bacterium]
ACTNAIIFCNRKTDVDICAKSLKKYGYNAAAIHGDLDQSTRMRTLDGFREGTIRLLVASDVAARGLDVPSVSHVFNFDVPTHSEDYVHRIGRTGRAGRDGKAMMICSVRDEKYLEQVETLLQKPIPRLENPVKSRSKDTTAASQDTASAKPDRAKPEPAKFEQTPSDTSKPAPAKADRAKPSTAKSERPPAETVAKPDRHTKSDRAPKHGTASDGRGRRSRGGRDDGRTVVGMGDHLPSFIALSFDERRTG